MVSVTGVLSALKHPDPLRIDMQILSAPLTQPFFLKKKKKRTNKTQRTVVILLTFSQSDVHQPSVFALVCIRLGYLTFTHKH